MRYLKNSSTVNATITSLILIFSVITCYGQDLEFQHFSTRQGLSQANVWDIHQDPYGFIWIATEDGLNIYDGYSFTVFRHSPLDSTSISNSNVRCIAQDNNGNLWIGTRYGLNLYNRTTNTFTRFSV